MSLALTDHPAAAVPVRTRKPKATQATSRPKTLADEKPRKVSFYLSPESIRRLGVVASMEDSDKSRVLEQVIRTSPLLKRWVVSDRAKTADPGTDEVSSD